MLTDFEVSFWIKILFGWKLTFDTVRDLDYFFFVIDLFNSVQIMLRTWIKNIRGLNLRFR